MQPIVPLSFLFIRTFLRPLAHSAEHTNEKTEYIRKNRGNAQNEYIQQDFCLPVRIPAKKQHHRFTDTNAARCAGCDKAHDPCKEKCTRERENLVGVSFW